MERTPTFTQNPVGLCPSVLIADDVTYHVKDYVEVLSWYGIRCQTVDCVSKALRELRHSEPPYDVLITDMNMPEKPTREQVTSGTLDSLIEEQKEGIFAGTNLCRFVLSKYPTSTSVIVLTNLTEREVRTEMPDLDSRIRVLSKEEFKKI